MIQSYTPKKSILHTGNLYDAAGLRDRVCVFQSGCASRSVVSHRHRLSAVSDSESPPEPDAVCTGPQLQHRIPLLAAHLRTIPRTTW